jgi:hypothetical protein
VSTLRGVHNNDIDHRSLPGPNEWLCTEIDVDNDFGGAFCTIFQSSIDNPLPGARAELLRLFRQGVRACCPGNGLIVPDCCRCNRRQVEDPKRVFASFKSLNAQNKCPGIFANGGGSSPENTLFVTATDVAPGQVKQMLGVV